MVLDRKILEEFEKKADLIAERADGGIEKYRKGDATVQVTDASGKPVAGARVTVKQVSHAFRFGANIFMLDELESEEKNEAYKKRFAETFNMATLPFYWDTLEPERGKPRYGKDSPRVYRRPTPDLCIEYCEKHGIEPREHALAYDNFFPAWLKDASDDEVKAALEKRYREIAERYAHKIPTIEVTNEMLWDKSKTGFYFNPDYVRWCFALAEKYFPNNQLCINDWLGACWENDERYPAYIKDTLDKGARIDAVGMQYHLFFPVEEFYEKTRLVLDPEKLYSQMDKHAAFGKPLQITEVTVPAFSNEAEDEELQADMLEKLYTVWFSHPAVEQIVYWNLVDGYAHVPDATPEKIRVTQGDMTLGENVYYGGLLRFDLSPKPAYFRLKQLLEEVWHTELSVPVDEGGIVSFRGFYGDYEITVEKDGRQVTKTVSLAKGKENQFTLML